MSADGWLIVAAVCFWISGFGFGWNRCRAALRKDE